MMMVIAANASTARVLKHLNMGYSSLVDVENRTIVGNPPATYDDGG